MTFENVNEYENEQDLLDALLANARELKDDDVKDSLFYIYTSGKPFSIEFLDEVKINDKYPIPQNDGTTKLGILALYHAKIFDSHKEINWEIKYFTSLAKTVRKALSLKKPLKDKRMIITITDLDKYTKKIEIKDLPKASKPKSTK